MADRRGIIVPLLILAFIVFSPEPARPLPSRQLALGRTIDDAIAEEQHSLAVLRNSSYSPTSLPALNLTGLDEERGYAWDALPQVRERARSQLEYALGPTAATALQLNGNDSPVPLYKNITGFVHGKWIRPAIASDLPLPRVNLSEYATFSPFGIVSPREFGRNVTGDEGDIRLRFHGSHGLPSRSAHSEGTSNATYLSADFTIADGIKEHTMRLLGVYFPQAGHAILTTTSEKLAGIFLLPHLALSEAMFDRSRAYLNESIPRTIQRQIDGLTSKFNPWSPDFEGAPEAPVAGPECELVVYLQQHSPITASQATIASSVLSLLENEVRFPTGALVPPAPDLKFSMVAFSPDCGYLIESKGPPDFAPQDAIHLTGPKIEVLNNSSRNHVLFYAAVLAFQVFLLKRQMHEASTPSTRSRISLYTIAMLALGDGYTFMTFLLVSFFIGSLWVTVMATAFLSFVCVSFFGMRFLMDIWLVQAPERATRRREEVEEDLRREEYYQRSLQRLRDARWARQRPATNQSATQNGEQTNPAPNANTAIAPPVSTLNAPPPTNNATDNATQPPNPHQPPANPLPPPVTVPRPVDTGAAPVFMPSDQEGLELAQPFTTAPQATAMTARESFGSVYTRFYLLLLAVLFLSLNAIAWPSGLRRVYFTFLGFIYLSFWIPQINRNVQRNCRKALNWEFVIGQSILRYMPFAYFYSYKANVVFSEGDYISLTILGGWLWLQILLLVSQELVGPRWFVRKGWAPPAYDYHPVLREDEEGNTMPVGFSQASAPAPVSDATPSSPVAGRERSDSSRRASISIKETREKGKRIYDCAICMQELEVAVIESGSSGEHLSGPAGLLARRMYMVTPCRHIFHATCLEGWMKYRLQCPICRETLPPL